MTWPLPNNDQLIVLAAWDVGPLRVRLYGYYCNLWRHDPEWMQRQPDGCCPVCHGNARALAGELVALIPAN